MTRVASHPKQNATDAAVAADADRRRRADCACLFLTATGALLAALALLPQAPRLVWNFTGSVPVGLYAVEHAIPAKGDLVVIAPGGHARRTLSAYGALPDGRVLLKQLAAVSGDTVCRGQASLTVNGVHAATALLQSRDGRALPVWRGCRRLQAGEILLLAPHPASFDGRYFGPTRESDIAGIAHPLITLPLSGEIL